MNTFLLVALRSFLISLTIIGGQRLWEIIFKTSEFEHSLRSFLMLFAIGFVLSLLFEIYQKSH
ncbi:hypothetical protein CO667_04840 [Rhizobium sp. L43]|nr:hypothetical protein CO667_04840 [Rhizobium sp. L43]